MPGSVRIVVAAVSGYGIAVGVAAIGAFVSGMAFPQSTTAPPTTVYLAISVAIGFAGAVVAGYVCSRMAPDEKRLISVGLLLVLLLGMTVVMSRVMSADPRQPFGFLPLVTMLGVIGAWAGAMTERAVHGGSA